MKRDIISILIRMLLFGNWTFRPGRIQCFLLIQLKPKHHRLDDFNYSWHSVRMS